MSTQRETIVLEHERMALREPWQLETDALNGVSSIPGVSEVRVESIADGKVTLSYEWHGTSKFQQTDEHLKRHGVKRVWV